MANNDPDRITPATPEPGEEIELASHRGCACAQAASSTSTSSRTPSRRPSSKGGPSSSSSAVIPIPRPLTPSEHNASNRFLLLPLEILTLIVDFCDWPSARALRKTCVRLRTSFSVLTTIRKLCEHKENLLRNDDGVFPAPCYRCVRILPQSAFPCDAILQRTFDHRHYGYESRRCTECLLFTNNIPIGVSYFWRGKRYVHCARCAKHRTWLARWGSYDPPRFCGRCRDIRTVGHGIKRTLKSLQFWIGVMGALMVFFSTMAWLRIVDLWRGAQPYDSSVVSWAFFSATHTLFVQFSYWLLVLTEFMSRRRPRGRAHLLSKKLLRSDSAVFETGIEWAMVFASMCMPFAVSHIATVPLLGWSTLSWAAACLATRLRWKLD